MCAWCFIQSKHILKNLRVNNKNNKIQVDISVESSFENRLIFSVDTSFLMMLRRQAK